MALKFKIAKLDEVAETVRTLYRPEGDAFVLDVDGAVDKGRLDEFRNNNITLQQQLDKLKDVDPAKYRELIALQRKVEEKELIDKGEIDKVVALRVTSMKEEMEGQLKQTSTALSTANAQLSALLIDQAVKAAALKAGALTTALDDVVLRARSMFTIENGVPVPKNEKGEVIYGKDGTTPMSVDDWTLNLKKTALHLFASSSGSGAGGGRGTIATDMSKLSPHQKITLGLSQGGLQSSLPGT
jgi:hypothetical protein